MTLVEKLKTYLKRPSSVAFLVFAAVYAVALGSIFWGAWALDKVPVAPDCQTTFALAGVVGWFLLRRRPAGPDGPGQTWADAPFWIGAAADETGARSRCPE